MKAKLARVEKDIEEHRRSFVTLDLFNAIVSTIKDDLHDMRSDLKEVLQLISKNTKLMRSDDST